MTASIVAILFSLTIQLFMAKQHKSDNNQKGEVGHYDLYIFTAELPGSICNHKHCTKEFIGNLPERGTNMHGMWPQYNDGTWPQFCTLEKYSDKFISAGLQEELNANWVGVFNSNFQFRQHEFEKHGTCYATHSALTFFPTLRFLGQETVTNDQEVFFQTVLDLKKSLKIDQLIYEKDSYSLEEIQGKITQAYNITEFDLECEIFNGEQELSAFYICIGLDLQPINCPMSFLRDWHVQKRCRNSAEIVIRPLLQSQIHN